jgi:hypothetical protein
VDVDVVRLAMRRRWVYWSWQRPPGVSWATHGMESAAFFINMSNSHQAYVAWFRTDKFINTARTVTGWRKVFFIVFYRYSDHPGYTTILRAASVLLLFIVSGLLLVVTLSLFDKYTGFNPFGINFAH